MNKFRQAIISPSALTMVYPTATIPNYSHEQFLTDLIKEAEKDIRLCLEKGAYCVQIDFTEACFSFQIDPSGQLLRDFIRFNNRVLNRFIFSDQHRLGVYVCLSLYYFPILLGLFQFVFPFLSKGLIKILIVLPELTTHKSFLSCLTFTWVTSTYNSHVKTIASRY